jgi:hypothetical protein
MMMNRSSHVKDLTMASILILEAALNLFSATITLRSLAINVNLDITLIVQKEIVFLAIVLMLSKEERRSEFFRLENLKFENFINKLFLMQ